MSITAILKNDKRVKKAIERCKNADKDVDAWTDELFTLHASRSITSLNSTALLESAQRTSIDTDLDNQTVRSRAVAISMAALRQEIFVDEQRSYLRKYLASAYADDLKNEHKTVSDRKTTIDSALHQLTQSITRLNGAQRIATLIIEDCDAAGKTLYRINDVLNKRSKDR